MSEPRRSTAANIDWHRTPLWQSGTDGAKIRFSTWRTFVFATISPRPKKRRSSWPNAKHCVHSRWMTRSGRSCAAITRKAKSSSWPRPSACSTTSTASTTCSRWNRRSEVRARDCGLLARRMLHPSKPESWLAGEPAVSAKAAEPQSDEIGISADRRAAMRALYPRPRKDRRDRMHHRQSG